jgi:hypothetical protein
VSISANHPYGGTRCGNSEGIRKAGYPAQSAGTFWSTKRAHSLSKGKLGGRFSSGRGSGFDPDVLMNNAGMQDIDTDNAK